MKHMKPSRFLMPMIGLAILTLLQGCGASTADKLDFCSSYRLITIAPQDKITPHTAADILHDDDQFTAICHR